jgi:serine/threonine protein kinase
VADQGQAAKQTPGSEAADASDSDGVVKICKQCMTSRPADQAFCLECGAELVPIRAVRDSYLGETVSGKYKLVDKIGSGGMGEVYLGVNEPLGQRVAVKFLSRKYTDNEQVIMRFLNEARSYCKVSHPNAVTLLDYGQHTDGALFLLTEFVEGRSLTDTVFEDGPLSPRQALALGMQCAEVLGAAHRQGVIHRDLKPDNLMLMAGEGDRYNVKVLDFGIAKMVDDERGQVTETGSVFGTPEFMSPEQAQGHEADPRSDLYALGIILFYAMTGRLPFTDESQYKILEAHIKTGPPRPSEVSEIDVPMGIEAVIMKCLNKDPSGRFQDAEELVAALEEERSKLRSGSGVHPAPESPADPEPSPQSPQPSWTEGSSPTEAYPDDFASELEGVQFAESDAPRETFEISEIDLPTPVLDQGFGTADDGSQPPRDDSSFVGWDAATDSSQPDAIDFGDGDGAMERLPAIGAAAVLILVGALVLWNIGSDSSATGQGAEGLEERIVAATADVEAGRIQQAKDAVVALGEDFASEGDVDGELVQRFRTLQDRLTAVVQAKQQAEAALENGKCDRAESALITLESMSAPAAVSFADRLTRCRESESAKKARAKADEAPEPDPEPEPAPEPESTPQPEPTSEADQEPEPEPTPDPSGEPETPEETATEATADSGGSAEDDEDPIEPPKQL